MSDENSNGVNRRQILKAIAAGLAVGGCSPVHEKTDQNIEKPLHLFAATPAQKAWRRNERSSVAIIEVASYDEDIFSKIKPFISIAAIPSLKGQRVILKPNMVEIQGDKPIWTNPAVLKAAIELADYQGAKEVIVAEGPGHMRDTEYLMNATGIGPMLKKMGIKFVDLNLDDIAAVPNHPRSRRRRKRAKNENPPLGRRNLFDEKSFWHLSWTQIWLAKKCIAHPGNS
jgi:hypothetical protein